MTAGTIPTAGASGGTEDADDNRPVKKSLGEYEIIRRISDGAQAAVYEARSKRDPESVAIKVFKDTCDDDSADMRFRREAELLKSMSHRNIVRYRDSFVVSGDWEDRRNCLVMEFMKGETLKDHLQKSPKGLPWQEARDIMEQMIAGLIYAREQHGIVHRDIKPSNIFVLTDGQVRLFDFGIARIGGESTKTGGGACMGSFDYMAPDFATADISAGPGDEPFRGDDLSDIFSLTMVFYEMLTGQPPWPRFGERPELGYLARWRTDTPKLHSRSPIAFRVIRHLTGFMDRGLNPKRAERFQTFKEMLEAFRELRPRVLKHKGKDDYELLDGLDKGGFGEVYRARRVRDGTIVAVKRLFTDRAPRRFLKEAEILRTYSHPNLVEYIDFFESINVSGNKQLFIVMEYLEGMPRWSLRNRIMDAAGGLEAGEVLHLFRYYLEALQYLHENVNQIIHRDIKPGNLYAPPGNPAKAKILDLGVARDVSGTETHGAAPGTWDYMAPEFVADNSRGSPQTDIFSMGLSLYEALTGAPAFPRTNKGGHDAAADFVARATGMDKANVDFTHEVFRQHPALEQIVGKSIARDPRRRFQSANQMRRAIMNVLKDMGRIGSLGPDYADVKEGDNEMIATAAATGATVIEKETGAVHEWQTRVLDEKKKRNVRRSVVAGCVCLTVVFAGWLVIYSSGRKAGGAKTSVSHDARSAKPEPVAVKRTDTVVGPVTLPAAQSKVAADTGRSSINPGDVMTSHPRAAETPAEMKSVPHEAAVGPVEPPVKPVATETNSGVAAALPATVPGVADDRDKALRELLKDLRMLRIRSIVSSSYEAFFDDASSRVENARLSISQPEYEKDRDNPEVKKEQERLWFHIADNAVGCYRNTKDGRFLAAARGALWGSTVIDGSELNAQTCSAVIKKWNEPPGRVDFSKLLPLPMTEAFKISTDADGRPAKNVYTAAMMKTGEFSKSSAGMLPVALSVGLRAQAGKDEVHDVTLELMLVPPAKTEKGTIATPFYLAKVETTLGMMRSYRDGARADVARDPELSRYFTGRLETQSIQQNDYPYQLASVNEAFEFCNWLSHSHGFQSVYRRESDRGNWTANSSADGFRLPTGQEWEYAARLGIDWYQAAGNVSWQQIRAELDRDHADSLVWFYYKNGPRPFKADGRVSYPIGAVDLCGNMGELAMKNAKWQNMEKESTSMVVCGGNFKHRTADKVMPWSTEEFNMAENVGFRVILPVRTDVLLK